MQPLLGEHINIFKNYEEILIILLCIGSFYKIIVCKKKIKITKYEFIVAVLLSMFLFVGIISGFKGQFQSGKNILISGILTIKIFLCYFLCKMCFCFSKVDRKFMNLIYRICKVIIIFNFLILLINIPLKFLKTYGKRFGIDTISIGFPHPSQLDFYIISICTIMLFLSILLNKSKRNFIFYWGMSLIIIIFTGRSKAIIFFIGFYIVFLFVYLNKRLTFKQILCVIPIGAYIGYDRIMSELISETGPRGVLLRTATDIARDYFPLGSGFGSFGSHISRVSYSNIYYIYGLSNIYGFTQWSPRFITDSQWAMIIGETGITGFIIYILILIYITIVLWRIPTNTIYKLVINSLWIYGVISSISDTILMGYRGIAIICISVYIKSILEHYKI